MKHIIEYESEKLLPDDLLAVFDDFEKHISEYKYEPDKLLCLFGGVRHKIILFIANNRKGE